MLERYIFTNVCLCARVYMHIRRYMHIPTHICLCIYIYMCVSACTQTHNQKHTIETAKKVHIQLSSHLLVLSKEVKLKFSFQ